MQLPFSFNPHRTWNSSSTIFYTCCQMVPCHSGGKRSWSLSQRDFKLIDCNDYVPTQIGISCFDMPWRKTNDPQRNVPNNLPSCNAKSSAGKWGIQLQVSSWLTSKLGATGSGSTSLLLSCLSLPANFYFEIKDLILCTEMTSLWQSKRLTSAWVLLRQLITIDTIPSYSIGLTKRLKLLSSREWIMLRTSLFYCCRDNSCLSQPIRFMR